MAAITYMQCLNTEITLVFFSAGTGGGTIRNCRRAHSCNQCPHACRLHFLHCAYFWQYCMPVHAHTHTHTHTHNIYIYICARVCLGMWAPINWLHWLACPLICSGEGGWCTNFCKRHLLKHRKPSSKNLVLVPGHSLGTHIANSPKVDDATAGQLRSVNTIAETMTACAAIAALSMSLYFLLCL